MKKKYTTLLPTNWRDDYKADKRYWNNAEEYRKVGELCERLDELKDAKLNRCYWGEDGGTHTSWHDRWDYLSKLVNMWRRATDADDPRPDLKSTHTFNAVETAMVEMYDLNLMPGVVPWTKKGEKYASAVENLIKYPILRYNMNEVWLDAFQEALWLGNAFIKVEYAKVIRDVKLKKLRDFTKEEVEQMAKDGKPVYEEKTIVDYNDVKWTHISPYEYYPDSYARKQHGYDHQAVDGIHEYVLSYEQFQAKFGGRPDLVNLDKVKAYEGIDDRSNPLFRFPEGYSESNSVVIQEWEHTGKDFCRIVANGVWLGDIPLPNHKSLGVVHIGCIKIPHQYYYMGLGDVISGLQTEDEAIRNMFLELLQLNLTPPIIANNQVAGEFQDQYETVRYAAGEMISISGNPNEIQWFAPAITRLSEVFGFRQQIKEDVISVSLIDPKASSLPTNTPTAFEAMQMSAATMKSFMKTLKNFSRGIRTGLQLQWSLQRQEYPLCLEKKDVEGRLGDQASAPLIKSRTIYTRDVKIIAGEDGVREKNTPGKINPLEIKDEYLGIDTTDIDIIIKPESMIPVSKASRVRKSEEALAQLYPLLEKDAQMRNIRPLDHEPIQLLLKEYLRSHDLDEDILGQNQEDKEDQINRATDQHQAMRKNAKLETGDSRYKPVMGIFGEPTTHKNEHLKMLAALSTLLENKEAERMEFAAEVTEKAQLQQIPPTEADMSKAEKMRKEIEELENFNEQLKEHLAVDQLTPEMATEAVLTPQTQPEGAPPQMPPEMMSPDMMMPQMPPEMMGATDIPSPTNAGMMDVQQQML